MTTLNKNELLEGLAQYGYSLLRPSVVKKPEALLENLVDQEDARLMEGFPVVLANAMKNKTQLDWEKGKTVLSRDNKSREKFTCLLALSYLLFKLFGLEPGFQNRAKTLLNQFESARKVLGEVEEDFLHSKPVKAGGVVFFTDRFKNTFRSYGLSSVDREAVEKKKHELQFELLVSQIFTPKQKNLLRKKLTGTPLNKTEREYFSRVLKKRLKALASDELHQMARQILS